MSYNYDLSKIESNILGGGLGSSEPMWQAAQAKLNAELNKRNSPDEKFSFLRDKVYAPLTTALQKSQQTGVSENELKAINKVVEFINTKIAALVSQRFSNATTQSACNQLPENLRTKQMEAQRNYIKRSVLNATAVLKQNIRTQYTANTQERDRRLQEVTDLVTAFDFENLDSDDFEQLFTAYTTTRSMYQNDIFAFIRAQFATRREAIATNLRAMPEEQRRQFQISNAIPYSQLVLLQKTTLYVAQQAPRSTIPEAPPVPEDLIPVAPPVPDFELVQAPQEQAAQQPPQLPTTKAHTLAELERQPTIIVQEIPPITKPPVARQISTQVIPSSPTIPEAPPVPTITPVEIPQQPDALDLVLTEQPASQQQPLAQVQAPRVEIAVAEENPYLRRFEAKCAILNQKISQQEQQSPAYTAFTNALRNQASLPKPTNILLSSDAEGDFERTQNAVFNWFDFENLSHDEILALSKKFQTGNYKNFSLFFQHCAGELDNAIQTTCAHIAEAVRQRLIIPMQFRSFSAKKAFVLNLPNELTRIRQEIAAQEQQEQARIQASLSTITPQPTVTATASAIPEAPPAPVLAKRTPSPTSQTSSTLATSAKTQKQQKNLEAAAFDAEALSRIRALRREPTMDEYDEDDDLSTGSETVSVKESTRVELPELNTNAQKQLEIEIERQKKIHEQKTTQGPDWEE